MILSNRRGNQQKLIHRKFHANVEKSFFAVLVTKHWNRLRRETAVSLSVDIQEPSVCKRAICSGEPVGEGGDWAS